MFNMNSMLLSSLLILQFVGVSGDKTCAGKEVQDLDDDCTKIEKNPLVFKGNQDGEFYTFLKSENCLNFQKKWSEKKFKISNI